MCRTLPPPPLPFGAVHASVYLIPRGVARTPAVQLERGCSQSAATRSFWQCFSLQILCPHGTMLLLFLCYNVTRTCWTLFCKYIRYNAAFHYHYIHKCEFLLIYAIFTIYMIYIINILILSVLQLNNCPFRPLILITGSLSTIIIFIISHGRYPSLHILIRCAIVVIKILTIYRELVLYMNIGGNMKTQYLVTKTKTVAVI